MRSAKGGDTPASDPGRHDYGELMRLQQLDGRGRDCQQRGDGRQLPGYHLAEPDFQAAFEKMNVGFQFRSDAGQIVLGGTFRSGHRFGERGLRRGVAFLGPLGAGQEGKGGNHRHGAVILAGPVDDFGIRGAGVYFQVPFDHAVRPDMLGQVERLIVERAPDVEFINHGDARLLGIGWSVGNTRFHRRSWGARDESDLSRGSRPETTTRHTECR